MFFDYCYFECSFYFKKKLRKKQEGKGGGGGCHIELKKV